LAEGSATVRVTGGSGAQREGFRERVRWLLVRDGDAPGYAEDHTAEHLEYRFAIEAGIPFPTFVEASQAFPGMRVEAQWPPHGRSRAGRVVFESGMVIEKVELP
jgi:hypothetical protein